EIYTRGWRRKQKGVRLRPETRERLIRLGHERALAYKLMALTGLRVGELAAVQVRDVLLNRAQIVLDAKFEKARRGAVIPLRQDLVEDLRRWIEKAPPDRNLVRVSHTLLKVLIRDLEYAGIPRHDDRGRAACLHSLRYSFASWLSSGGVSPRVAMAALRHSDVS